MVRLGTAFACAQILLILSQVPLASQTSNGSSPPSPRPRYWTIPFQSASIVVGLDPTTFEAGPVPLRSDPEVLVLVYHNLVYGRPGAATNRDILNFENDLAFYRRRFRIVDFAEVAALMGGPPREGEDLAVLTFDDGDLSTYAILFPMVRRFGLKVTLFIVPNLIGEAGYLTWEMLKEMSDYRDPRLGRLVTIGSHTMNHVYLGQLSLAEAERELKDSKRILEERLGVVVDCLALPYGSGFDSPALLGLAKSFGYRVIRPLEVEAPTRATLRLDHLGAYSVDSMRSDDVIDRPVRLVGH